MIKKTKIDVEGMHCHSCEVLIEDALNETEGVKRSAVSHKEGTAIVEYDDSKTDIGRIRKAIEKEGYKTAK